MEKSAVFQKNLKALSVKSPELCALLLKTEETGSVYTFLESRTGEKIPARLDPSGTARPLHSLMDPRKEARRLIDSVEGECFLALLGLGAPYYAEAALERKYISKVLVIEYGINSLAELFNNLDYSRLFSDPRFSLFVDLSDAELNNLILNLYQPVLNGGFRVIPLRSRTASDAQLFTQAANVIAAAMDKVSADYSVQVHFGKRWFGNIIHNLKNMNNETEEALPSIKKAAVTAAGPSLNLQIERLRKKRKELFLIATDTSLPCLLNAGIIPDAVISIDCQHISYYHFMHGFPDGVPLYLDLASPPLLASLCKERRFFSCGHPLTRYISRAWIHLPELDSSGGNVTYAAVSLAEQMGAEEIELYGADYSYPAGVSYAKGSYIYSFFAKKANRFSPIEAQASAFLFRTPLEKTSTGKSWYYQTQTMSFYREKLEEKSQFMKAALIPIKGMGAPIKIKRISNVIATGNKKRFTEVLIKSEKIKLKADDFLSLYRNEINNLPKPENPADYFNLLKAENRSVFTSLLPLFAAFKHHYPKMSFPELFDEVINYSLEKIDLF